MILHSCLGFFLMRRGSFQVPTVFVSTIFLVRDFPVVLADVQSNLAISILEKPHADWVTPEYVESSCTGSALGFLKVDRQYSHLCYEEMWSRLFLMTYLSYFCCLLRTMSQILTTFHAFIFYSIPVSLECVVFPIPEKKNRSTGKPRANPLRDSGIEIALQKPNFKRAHTYWNWQPYVVPSIWYFI